MFVSFSHPDYKDPEFYFDVGIAILKQVIIYLSTYSMLYGYIILIFFLGVSIFPPDKFNLLARDFI